MVGKHDSSSALPSRRRRFPLVRLSGVCRVPVPTVPPIGQVRTPLTRHCQEGDADAERAARLMIARCCAFA